MIAILRAMACFAQEHTATLTGTVIDPYGSPVEGFVVQIWSEQIRSLSYTVSTDAAGQFRFTDVLPGSYRIWDKTVIQLAPDQPMSLPRVITIPGGDCTSSSIIAMQRLAAGNDLGTLRGSVKNSRGSGLPIAGASVSMKCAECVTTTNEAGQFTFANLKPGNYDVTVSMPGFYRESFPDFLVVKNLDWTYGAVLLDKCETANCGYRKQPRRPKTIYCQ